jgi:2-polyprenyl-3-methyl-5-hydroxy-6-metoxy-1,4-benzoquinol methylase
MCCGIGWTSYAISKVANSVVGIDYSEEAIEEAKSNYQSPNLKFKNMNALDLEFPPEAFDLVVSMEAIEHFTKENGLLFLDQVKRVLKKDGLFIGSTPEVENRSILKLYSLQLQDPFHLFLYSKSILKKTLSKYFTHVEVYSQPEDWLLFKCKK